jgi:hypothetical protein
MKALSDDTKRLIQQGVWALYSLCDSTDRLLVIPKVECGCAGHKEPGKLFLLDRDGNILRESDYSALKDFKIESVCWVGLDEDESRKVPFVIG